MIARSLRWRLLLGAVAAILLALVVAWGFMTLLFERHLDRRLDAELTRDALALVAGLSLDAAGLPVAERELADPRLQTPAGGYYWQVTSAAGVLRSRSLWDASLPMPADAAPNTHWRARRAPGPFGEQVALLERSLVVDAGGPAVTVQLAQDSQPLRTARDEFGRELALFLLALWLVLSAAAWLQVALGLRPLGRVRGDLAALRDSARVRLPASHLREIQPLADAINALADARERDLERARRRAADLAHGLKTPLAALAAQSRRAREAGADLAADGMDRALAAIGATVEGELARARIAAATQSTGESVAVRGVVEQLASVLEHTERGERVAFAIEVPDDLLVPMPPDSLSELLGAVMDNAVRYARRQIRVRGVQTADAITLDVEDDGPGIASDRMREALARGGRLDESGGAGLGLSIARELADATGGSIELGASPLGGLAVAFTWRRTPSPR